MVSSNLGILISMTVKHIAYIVENMNFIYVIKVQSLTLICLS